MLKGLRDIVSKVCSKTVAAVAVIGVALGISSQAKADMAALFTAADTSSLSSNISTVLVAFIGVALLFTAYRFIKRSLRS